MENSPLWSAHQIALDPRCGKPSIRRKYAKARKKRVVIAPPITPAELERIWNTASAFLKEKGYIISREDFETIKPEWPSEAGLYARAVNLKIISFIVYSCLLWCL
jgi:hypothetical protein